MSKVKEKPWIEWLIRYDELPGFAKALGIPLKRFKLITWPNKRHSVRKKGFKCQQP